MPVSIRLLGHFGHLVCFFGLFWVLGDHTLLGPARFLGAILAASFWQLLDHFSLGSRSEQLPVPLGAPSQSESWREKPRGASRGSKEFLGALGASRGPSGFLGAPGGASGLQGAPWSF